MQVKLSEKIKEFIQESTGNYGKAKLVLQKNKFFVESAYPDVLKVLLKVHSSSAISIPFLYSASITQSSWPVLS